MTQQLATILGYTFKDNTLLTKALSHKSHSAENYERLEFLGDSLLNFIIGEALFHRFDTIKEGELSQLRAKLVKGKTLAEIAQELNLGKVILLGAGELKSGGRERSSILADVVESIIGAIYLDAGMAECKQFVLRIYGNRLAALNPETFLKDPKTRLQEYLQAQKMPLPDYQLVTSRGQDHQQTFTVACMLHDYKQSFEAEGSSRRKAEQAAAEQALDFLKEH